MDITIDMIKQLREATAAGMGACKEALLATAGNPTGAAGARHGGFYPFAGRS